MQTVLVVNSPADDPDIEEAAAGGDVALVFRRVEAGGSLPDADLARADGLLNCRSTHRVPADLIGRMPRLRAIQQGGVGYDHIDLDAASRRGIVVQNTPDYGTTEVASHAVALTLNLLRGIQAYDRRLRRSNAGWDARAVSNVRRLLGLRVGIVGLGRIGTAAALRFKAFGMDVAFHDPYAPAGQELALGLTRCGDLEALMRRSDVLSLHAPLGDETRHMIDAGSLAWLPEGAVLVNTARGGLVDLAAVGRALEGGRLGGAALDVFEREPLDRSDPLIAAWAAGEAWLDDRLILTPHAAFYSAESLRDFRRLSMSYLVEYLRTGRARCCVNRDLLRRYEIERSLAGATA